MQFSTRVSSIHGQVEESRTDSMTSPLTSVSEESAGTMIYTIICKIRTVLNYVYIYIYKRLKI